MIAFYEQAFGWDLNPLGEEMGNYVLAKTAEPNHAAPPEAAHGAIGGGFFPRNMLPQHAHTNLVIGVEDIQAAMRRVDEAGGQALGGDLGSSDPHEIPGVGLYARFIDTEGNKLAMLQPNM